jgi:hypothetical protein
MVPPVNTCEIADYRRARLNYQPAKTNGEREDASYAAATISDKRANADYDGANPNYRRESPDYARANPDYNGANFGYSVAKADCSRAGAVSVRANADYRPAITDLINSMTDREVAGLFKLTLLDESEIAALNDDTPKQPKPTP